MESVNAGELTSCGAVDTVVAMQSGGLSFVSPDAGSAVRALVLAVFAGMIGCSSGGSAAYKTYVRFTHAALQGDCATLYAMAQGSAVKHADYLCQPRKIKVFDKEIDVGSIAGNVAGMQPASTPFNRPIVRELTIESERLSGDGAVVDLVVLEKSLQRHGGQLEPTWLMRHTATASKVGSDWKITHFKEEVLKQYGAGEQNR